MSLHERGAAGAEENERCGRVSPHPKGAKAEVAGPQSWSKGEDRYYKH